MCPQNPVGYAQLSGVYLTDYMRGNTKSPWETLEKGYELAKKALAMDDSTPIAHNMLCLFYVFKRKYDKAIAEGELAVALYPSASASYFAYASALHFACRPEEAIPMYQKAIRLNPNASAITFAYFGMALADAGQFKEAVSTLKRSIQRAPDYVVSHIGLVIAYSSMGREQEARAEAAEILRIDPQFSLDYFAKTVPLKDQSQIDKGIDILRKAGLK
jgi:adenylate cyclase